MLVRVFDWPFDPHRSQHIHANRQSHRRWAPSADETNRAQEILRLDYKLYDFARQQYNKLAKDLFPASDPAPPDRPPTPALPTPESATQEQEQHQHHRWRARLHRHQHPADGVAEESVARANLQLLSDGRA